MESVGFQVLLDSNNTQSQPTGKKGVVAQPHLESHILLTSALKDMYYYLSVIFQAVLFVFISAVTHKTIPLYFSQTSSK